MEAMLIDKSEFSRLQQLLPVANREVDSGSEVNTVNGRDLHEFLEVKTRFNDWIRRRIDEYGFLQGLDFVTILNSEYSPPATDYHLSLDMAKELGMVEKTEQGRLVRRYFLECERLAKEAYDRLTDGEKMLRHAEHMIRMEKRQAETEWKAAQAYEMAEVAAHAVAVLDAKVSATDMPTHSFSVMGYANYVGRAILLDESKMLGRRATKLSRERGCPTGQIRDPRFGLVGVYLEEILKEVFDDYFRDLFRDNN